MIRATADSNIYISALQFAGLPRDFLNAAREGSFVLAISDPIVEEIRRILGTKFRWQQEMVTEAIAQLRGLATSVSPTKTIDVIKNDPEDNRILECAVTAGSSYIVTGDNDLLRLREYAGIRIIKVAEFLPLVPLRSSH